MNGSYAVQSQRPGAGASTASRLARGSRRQGLSPLEIMTLVAIAALLIAGAVLARPGSATVTPSQPVQVQAGQTLWSIAQTHPIQGLTTAQVADSIARSNGLTTSTLQAGQTLLVPTQSADTPQMASR